MYVLLYVFTCYLVIATISGKQENFWNKIKSWNAEEQITLESLVKTDNESEQKV